MKMDLYVKDFMNVKEKYFSDTKSCLLLQVHKQQNLECIVLPMLQPKFEIHYQKV